MARPKVIVVGAGLAGAEASWQARRLGVDVDLYEMRPHVLTPAHRTGEFAELVCSNSLGSMSIKNASGLLKQEMRHIGSLIIETAVEHQVPAGGALAVDRNGFASRVTERLSADAGVNIIRAEVTTIPDSSVNPVVIATGPLTTESLARDIARFSGRDALFFFDAASPIVHKESIDPDYCFRGSRYGRDEEPDGDYINCPLDEQEYIAFREALLGAERAVPHGPDETPYFEGCLPVEEIARRGIETLRYGPMKPVGLTDPRTGKRPYAVVQLRQDDKNGSMYNIVGFQTSLKWGEQDRVLRLIPALRRAEFLRYGVMHRNTYLNAPAVLGPTMEAQKQTGLFFAGQLVGVEGYAESCAAGLVAGINAARRAHRMDTIAFPEETMIGALLSYVTSKRNVRLQPMNANWGLLPPVTTTKRCKKYRNEALAERALLALQSILQIAEPNLA